MSRSGYDYDCDEWALIRWRGAVASAFRGRRGQAFLREMLAALDALPEGKLIAGELECNGAVCALGAVGRARGTDMDGIDPYDRETVASTFGIAEAMAAEIVYMNDEHGPVNETPEWRWARMRSWIEAQLIEWEPLSPDHKDEQAG